MVRVENDSPIRNTNPRKKAKGVKRRLHQRALLRAWLQGRGITKVDLLRSEVNRLESLGLRRPPLALLGSCPHCSRTEAFVVMGQNRIGKGRRMMLCCSGEL